METGVVGVFVLTGVERGWLVVRDVAIGSLVDSMVDAAVFRLLTEG